MMLAEAVVHIRCEVVQRVVAPLTAVAQVTIHCRQLKLKLGVDVLPDVAQQSDNMPQRPRYKWVQAMQVIRSMNSS
jgi:hypothetical protein